MEMQKVSRRFPAASEAQLIREVMAMGEVKIEQLFEQGTAETRRVRKQRSVNKFVPEFITKLMFVCESICESECICDSYLRVVTSNSYMCRVSGPFQPFVALPDLVRLGRHK